MLLKRGKWAMHGSSLWLSIKFTFTESSLRWYAFHLINEKDININLLHFRTWHRPSTSWSTTDWVDSGGLSNNMGSSKFVRWLHLSPTADTYFETRSLESLPFQDDEFDYMWVHSLTRTVREVQSLFSHVKRVARGVPEDKVRLSLPYSMISSLTGLPQWDSLFEVRTI